jgi:hypothetical protein
MELLILWILINIIVGYAIGARKNEVGSAIALSILLGPLGWLIAALSEGRFRKCPFCAERMQPTAIVCPHCQRDLPRSAEMPQGVPPAMAKRPKRLTNEPDPDDVRRLEETMRRIEAQRKTPPRRDEPYKL